MLAGRLSPEQLLREMETFFVDHEQIHAPPPNVPLTVPPHLGVTLVSGRLVDAVKKGRSLRWKVGGVQQVTENGAVFRDGTCEEFDIIVYATAYKVQVPCLSEEMQQIITPRDSSNMLELYDYTFHPDLKGISFIGMLPPGTSSIPMYETQARWVASTISGQVPMVDEIAMRETIEENKILRKEHKYIELTLGFEVLDLFAKHGGFEIDFFRYPSLSKALLLGPLCPSQFRMFGNGKRDGCKEMYEQQIEVGGYHAGDNNVERKIVDELKIVVDVLEKKGIAPKRLREAVENLTPVS
ncbi:dimethylaniline monooxygenase [Gracilaria domingensis]|nr:dimethylaniline monooxygenase [Gracilaria domingensis]